jgi:hypothetical protein
MSLTQAETDSSYNQAADAAKSEPVDTSSSSDAEGQQSGQPGSAADASRSGASDSFDPKQYPIVFRGDTRYPKDRQHITTLMQQGWAYSTRAQEMAAKEQELKAQEQEFVELKKLATAFETNPALKERIMGLYQEVLSGVKQARTEGDQQAATDGNDLLKKLEPMLNERLAPFQKATQELTELQQSIAVEKAQKELDSEVEKLKSTYKDDDWTTPDETGHDLLWQVEKIAYDKNLSLDESYRLYRFDHLRTQTEAATLKKAQEERIANKKRGVVDVGTSASSGVQRSQGYDGKGKNWNEVAADALKEWTK